MVLNNKSSQHELNIIVEIFIKPCKYNESLKDIVKETSLPKIQDYINTWNSGKGYIKVCHTVISHRWNWVSKVKWPKFVLTLLIEKKKSSDMRAYFLLISIRIKQISIFQITKEEFPCSKWRNSKNTYIYRLNYYADITSFCWDI